MTDSLQSDNSAARPRRAAALFNKCKDASPATSALLLDSFSARAGTSQTSPPAHKTEPLHNLGLSHLCAGRLLVTLHAIHAWHEWHTNLCVRHNLNLLVLNPCICQGYKAG